MFSSRQTFWIAPTTPSGDTYWANVMLLLNTNNSGTLSDRIFDDISASNLAITTGTHAAYAGDNPANSNGSFGSYFNSGTFSGGLRVASGGPTYSGDFTVECWARVPSDYTGTGYPSPIISANNSGFFSHQPVAGRTNTWRADSYGGPSFNFTSGQASNDGVWRHMALVRSGNTSDNLKYFFDGVLKGNSSATSTGTLSFSAFNLGCGTGTGPGAGDNQYTGFIALARLSNVARYTSNFTPQTTPFTTDGNTNFLMNGNEGAFYDVSLNGYPIRQIGTMTEQSNTYQKFTGANTIKHLGNGNTANLLSYPERTSFATSSFNMTGDFTWEAFVYVDTNATQASTAYIFNSSNLKVTTNNASNTNVFSANILGTNVVSSANCRDSTWHHLAVARTGSNITFYIDGNSVGSNVSNSANVLMYSQQWLGGANAYLGQMRITKGVARYTANFTPPTTAFPDF